jgi:hypothetical protein
MNKTMFSVIDIEHGIPQNVKDRVIAALKDKAIDFSDCPRLTAEQLEKIKYHGTAHTTDMPIMTAFKEAI